MHSPRRLHGVVLNFCLFFMNNLTSNLFHLESHKYWINVEYYLVWSYGSEEGKFNFESPFTSLALIKSIAGSQWNVCGLKVCVTASGAAQSVWIVSYHDMSSAYESELIVSYVCLINPFSKLNLLTVLACFQVSVENTLWLALQLTMKNCRPHDVRPMIERWKVPLRTNIFFYWYLE
jgi:hypothetical protein